jgi:Xaa-Pro dipeptidase
MPLHFHADEFARRRSRVITALTEAGLHGLLMFRQESMYYLTGFDTYGFVFFQCLYLGVDGTLTLLTRAPDLRQAQRTSVIEDIRIWVDQEAANPADALRDLLEAHGCRGKRLGIELESYGLTGRNEHRVAATLHGFCDLQDASDLVNRLRVVKSPAELAYVRRAAQLADAALEAAVELAYAGAFEGDILAAMMGSILRGGGDFPAHDFIIGSGPDALLFRYHSGRRHLGEHDQLSLEFGAAYRHYHANLIRTIPIGGASPLQIDMHQAAVAALHAAKDALRPGRPIGEVFDAHARVLDAAGFRDHRLNACGYSLGGTFLPSWMDWPMFYHGNPVIAEPNMVFFPHILILDSAKGVAMSTGHTVVVTDSGCETLSTFPLELIVH